MTKVVMENQNIDIDYQINKRSTQVIIVVCSISKHKQAF
jgi:hypothetical protein